MMIEDLNSLVKEYADLRKKYQDAYAESSELKHRCDTKKFELIEILNYLKYLALLAQPFILYYKFF